jgi:hypothetical protein
MGSQMATPGRYTRIFGGIGNGTRVDRHMGSI